MASTITGHQFRRGGNTPIYPWDDWTDGAQWKLIAGTDFTCRPQTLRGQCHAKAIQRRMVVATSIVDGGAAIVVQFTPMPARKRKR